MTVYSRCISCRAPLGRNDVLEVFPVGRRLAFDPLKGRLWVLCRSCRAWNLAPIEERWEATEVAERLFSTGAIEAATSNVSLRRLRDGTELVRIGQASRPEIATWRYGGRLSARRRRHYAAGGLITIAGTAVMGWGAPAVIAVAMGMGSTVRMHDRWPLMRTQDGRVIRRSDAHHALLMPSGAVGWQLVVPNKADGDIVLQGGEGLRALRALLPRINWGDWRSSQLENATSELERVGSAERLIRLASEDLGNAEEMYDPRYRWNGRSAKPKPHRIWASTPVIPLALEMAANDEIERRALDGEMALLESEWRGADELAGISDDLLFPDALRLRMLAWRSAHAQHSAQEEA